MGKQARIKKMRQQIKPVMAKMPLIMKQTREKHYLTIAEYAELHNLQSKEEILKAEELHNKAEAARLPGIPVWMPVQLYRNHDRRIKKAFLQGGNNAMKDYIGKQVDTVLDYEKRMKEEKNASL